MLHLFVTCLVKTLVVCRKTMCPDTDAKASHAQPITCATYRMRLQAIECQ